MSGRLRKPTAPVKAPAGRQPDDSARRAQARPCMGLPGIAAHCAVTAVRGAAGAANRGAGRRGSDRVLGIGGFPTTWNGKSIWRARIRRGSRRRSRRRLRRPAARPGKMERKMSNRRGLLGALLLTGVLSAGVCLPVCAQGTTAPASAPAVRCRDGAVELAVAGPAAPAVARVRPMGSADPQRQQALASGSQRWMGMSQDQRTQARQRFNQWQQLPQQRREQLRQRWEDFRSQPPARQQAQREISVSSSSCRSSVASSCANAGRAPPRRSVRTWSSGRARRACNGAETAVSSTQVRAPRAAAVSSAGVTTASRPARPAPVFPRRAHSAR